ncbi:MAG: proprotein convertase P-domain-containing protein, partial [Acidobacteriota bacterium]|nr:proprotein convertase P-domain-containing protein [Acidobacteriota bacterium]
DGLQNFETNLSGPQVTIVDECGAMSETAVCSDGVDLGLKYGTNCDTDPGASPGNNAAARTSYFHMNRIFETARFYDATSPWLSAPLPVEVNQPGSCNAFWTDPEIRMLGEGNGCANTGELSGVLVHEWGHGYDHNDGGGEDVPSEAYSDVVAIFYNRASCMSRGWYNDGRTCTGYGDTCLTCTGVRDHDWAARLNNTPTTPTNFTVTSCPSGPGGPCGREAHCEAYPIGESIFDLATRDLPATGMDQATAWQLAERLWYSTRLGAGGNIYDCFRHWLSHSCFAYSWMQRMMVADDDDGDLANGTPHAAAIWAAFDRHNLSCGNVDDADNQSTSGCPSLATPVLSLVETGPGTELSWPGVANAGEIRVYRNERGCDLSQVPIASLAGTATMFVDTEADPSLPRHYRIEALGSSPACHSPVSNCESTPLSARTQPLDFQIVETGTINGIPDPGETVTLPVTAFNSGLDSSTGTVGTLTFADPAQGTVLDGSATWSDIGPSGVVESDAPHFEVEVADTVNCGDTVNWFVEVSAANSVAARKRFGVTLGVKDREYLQDVSQPIPDQTAMPVVSQLVVADDEVIDELDVRLGITHDEAEEVVVELTSPEGTTVRLHDQTAGTSDFGLFTRYDQDRSPDGPGTMADFVGESSAGTWELSIEDLGAVSTGGQLQNWTLYVTSAGAFDCEEATCAAPPLTEAPTGLTVGRMGNDLDFSWNGVAMAAGYNLQQTADRTFGAGISVAGSTAGATTWTFTDGVSSTPALTFFQVRATNSCGVEGP